jgi:exopolysaccharide production protein ExoQ
VSMASRSVFADHLDVNQVYGKAWTRFESFLVCFILAIHSTAVVTLPSKLGVPGLGFVWFFGGFLCMAFAVISPVQTLKAMVRGWPFVALTIWAAASTQWTVNQYETLRGVLLLLSTHLFAFALAARFSWYKIIELLAWTICGLVAVSILFVVGLPQIGQMQGEHQGAWSGVWAEKQAMGIYACHGILAALAMVWRGPKYRWWWLGVVICALGIIGSTGRTALITGIVSVAFGFWLRVFYRSVIGKVIGGWVAIVGTLIAIPIATGGFDTVLKALGRSSDLTGRTEVWEAVQRVGDIRPSQGWGFQAVFRGKDDMTSPYQWIMDQTDFLPANAHSSWLDIYIQLGNVGVALLVIATVWAWLSILLANKVSNNIIAFCGSTLAAITFISFTETNFVTPMELQWFLVVLIATKLFLGIPLKAQATDQQDEVEIIDEPLAGQLNGDTFTY